MKILVIGASSFTGQHFCRYAREKGAEVIEASLRDEWHHHSHAIVNFAAANVVAPSWGHPGDYFRANVLKQLHIWHSVGINKYVHVSTPEVYGSTSGWVTEDAPYNPSTPYAVSRAAAEMMLKCYHKQYGFPVVFTRSANVYGPGQQLYRLIPKLIVSIKKGIKFPLEGGGLSSRSFVHVRDVCDATWRVMIDGEAGSAYHVSGVMTHSIIGLVEIICAKLGVSMQDAIELAPERPGKDKAYLLDSNRIRKLGWTDTVWIEDGINEVIEWVERDWDTLKDQPLFYTHKP